MSDFLPAYAGSSEDPQNRDAEEAILGAILIDPTQFPLISAFLFPDDFYVHRNGWIWEAMGSLSKRNAPLDVLTVSTELDAQGRLNEAGGAAYLALLMNNVPTSQNAEAYGHIIEEEAIRRRMLIAASNIAQAAHDPRSNVYETLSDAERQLFETRQRKIVQRTLKQQVSGLFDFVEERSKNPRDVWGIPTGLPMLDWLLGGWQDDELTIFAGDSGIGKSILLGQFAKHVAITHHVILYSLEMRDRDFLMRLISADSGIMTKQMKSGKINDEDWTKFIHSSERIMGLNLHIDDNAELTLERLRSDLYRRKSEGKVDWVGVDYLGLMSQKAPDDLARQMALTRGLKLIAREFQVPIVVVHSTNKGGMDVVKASKKDITGPSQNIFNADNVMILTRDESTPKCRTLHICKSRNEAGEGTIDLVQREGVPAFAELEKVTIAMSNEPENYWDR